MEKHHILSALRKYFITGLAVVLPLFVTGYLAFAIFAFIDNILGQFVNAYLKEKLGFYIPGLGLILFLLLTLVTGALARQLLGRRFIVWLENSLIKLPLIRHIYPSLKQIVDFFFKEKELSFKKVVLVEYPRKGVWSLGFITNEGMERAKEIIKEDLINIFIPSSPGPLTGYFVLVARSDVIFLDISIEEAIKMIVSGGVLNPGENSSAIKAR